MPEKEGLLLGRTRWSLWCHRSASDERPSWRDGVPSEDAIRAFRARHREIILKNAEKMDESKFRKESFDHVEWFFKCWQTSRKVILGFYPMATECGTWMKPVYRATLEKEPIRLFTNSSWWVRCIIFGFHRITTQDIRNSFQVIGLFPVNWDFSKRFNNINDRINSNFSSELFRSSATSTISAIGSLHMRQADRRTADTVLNVARNGKEPSRILQRVAIVISEQKQLTPFWLICSRSSAQAPQIGRRRHCPSGTSRFRCDARRAPKNRRGKLRKGEEKQKHKVNHPAEKSKKRAKKSVPHVKSK